MTTVFTWVGYAAGTLTTIAFLPQVLHVWKRKSADDLHIGTLVSFTVGVTLWLVYGIGVRQRPVVVVTSPGSPNSAGLPTPCTFISAMDSAVGNALWSGLLPVTSVMEIPSTLNCDCDCNPP